MFQYSKQNRYYGAMEAETISKNAARPKSHTSRGNYLNRHSRRLRMCLIFWMLIAGVLHAQTYIDANGILQPFPTTTYNVTSSTTAMTTDRWYVVSSNVTVAERITVTGTVNIILRDSFTLTVNGGIDVSSGNALNIYAQSKGASMGKLIAKADVYKINKSPGLWGANIIIPFTGDAGIGGGFQNDGGSITICGGDITAIGSNAQSSPISGEARNGGGAGIGGGGGDVAGSYNGRTCGRITIYGGIVKATGGNASDGGTSWGGGGAGAGIGGGGGEGGWSNGTRPGAKGGSGATISIYGGTVTATGGARHSENDGGASGGGAAAIGGGGGGGGYNTGTTTSSSSAPNAIGVGGNGGNGGPSGNGIGGSGGDSGNCTPNKDSDSPRTTRITNKSDGTVEIKVTCLVTFEANGGSVKYARTSIWKQRCKTG